MILELPFIIIVLLMLKHYIIEHYWCLPIDRVNKKYSLKEPYLYKNAGKHLLASLFIYALITVSYTWLILALIVEFVARIFVEYVRTRLINDFNWTPDLDTNYWRLNGLCSLIYGVIYVLSAYVLITYSPQGFGVF